MLDKYGNFDGFNNDGEEISEENSLTVPGGSVNTDLSVWTGGDDLSALIAYLPERLTWDKSAGVWSSETMGEGSRWTGKLIAATTVWAKWSAQVGRPEDIQLGARPSEPGYEMGIRLIIESEDFLYYWDAFGVTFKSAQSAVRRALTSGGFFEFQGYKEISTNFGNLKIPTLTKVDEGKNHEAK